jgi:hypothetical protein
MARLAAARAAFLLKLLGDGGDSVGGAAIP